MSLQNSLAKHGAVRYGIAALATLVATGLIELIYHLEPVPNVSLLYVPVVLACATWFGLGAALTASVLSIAEYDYFLITPRLTFSVDRLDDILALLVLSIVAITAAHLASSTRSRADAAEIRANESAALNELSEALMSSEGLTEILDRITRLVTRVFRAEGCSVFIPGNDANLTRAAGFGASSPDPREAFAAANHTFRKTTEVTIAGKGERLGLISRATAAQYLPLRVGEVTVGVLEIIWPLGRTASPANARLLASFCAQIALAVDRSRSEEERARVRALEETDRLKSALLSAVSHDLRTPLASIKGAVTSLILGDQDWSAADRGELLDTIDAESDHLNRLVGNLLDVSRIEAGVLRPLLDWYDVREVIDGAVTEVTRNLPEDRVTMEIVGTIPLVHVDLVLVKQVLVNLLENALQCSESKVTVRCLFRDERLTLEVIDHGPGVHPERRERIFTPFLRSHEHSDSARGVGLGLAICRGIARAHDGTIQVGDTAGGGATFTVQLPQPSTSRNTVAVA